MASETEGPERRRLRPEKHEAIMTGGREVFAHDGYARATVGAIATAAEVSTRTIYKHFADKPALFAAVIVDSAERVADAETSLIEHHLSGVGTSERLEPALLAFATEWLDDSGEWLTGMPHAAAHRALIGQVHAEATHLGSDVIRAWWNAGAGRIRAELAAVLACWAERGLLHIDDAERAVVYFSQLVSATPDPPASTITVEERATWIADGVGVFLRAYRP